MSELDDFIKKSGSEFRLNLGALDGYKHEKEYVERAKESLRIPKKCYPDIVDARYEAAFQHGFIEACVDSYDEIKKLKYMIDNGLGWEDMKNDVQYPPRE